MSSVDKIKENQQIWGPNTLGKVSQILKNLFSAKKSSMGPEYIKGIAV